MKFLVVTMLVALSGTASGQNKKESDSARRARYEAEYKQMLDTKRRDSIFKATGIISVGPAIPDSVRASCQSAWREYMFNKGPQLSDKCTAVMTAPTQERLPLRLGMRAADARLSAGKPDHINVSTGVWGVHEQWVYRNKNLYLYFEDGILTAIQDEKR